MTSFRRHLEAIGSALLLIQRLPEDAVWSLTCTNDDDVESPSTLNIFAPEDQWRTLIETLQLGRSVDSNVASAGDQFISFRQGTLYISLIEQERS